MTLSTHLDRRHVLKAGAWSVPAITVAGAAPSLAASPGGRVVAGTLTWGVKRSFRNYIVNMLTGFAPGKVTLSGGVSQTGGEDSPFVWPAGVGTVAEDGAISVQYSGTVNLWKHDGALDVTIANPLLEVTPAGTGTLSVTYTSTAGDASTLVLADLNSVVVMDGGSTVVANNGDLSVDQDGATSTLAPTGTVVFSGAVAPGAPTSEFYAAGDPMNAFETTLTVN